jgi:hypothetical protein
MCCSALTASTGGLSRTPTGVSLISLLRCPTIELFTSFSCVFSALTPSNSHAHAHASVRVVT